MALPRLPNLGVEDHKVIFFTFRLGLEVYIKIFRTDRFPQFPSRGVLGQYVVGWKLGKSVL